MQIWLLNVKKRNRLTKCKSTYLLKVFNVRSKQNNNKKINSLHTNSWVVITGNPLALNFMINYVSLRIFQKALSYEPELILQPSYYYVCDPLQACWWPWMSCGCKTSIVYSLEALHISLFISAAFFYLISMLIPCSLAPLPLFTLYIWILNSTRILCILGTDGVCRQIVFSALRTGYLIFHRGDSSSG